MGHSAAVHDRALRFVAVVFHGGSFPRGFIKMRTVLNKVNLQAPLSEAACMDDGVPLITLVKKAEIGPKPVLSNESLALEQTLSMLCSFLSDTISVEFDIAQLPITFKCIATFDNGTVVKLNLYVYD